MALNADGSIVASGSPEACIRITDPRMDRKVVKLRGHTANVRCLTHARSAAAQLPDMMVCSLLSLDLVTT